MDKFLKSISKNGHFRAFVLNSTETVRDAQHCHHTMPSSTAALGRTLIAAQILGKNEKGNNTITVKVLGDGPMGALVAVANTQGVVKGYVQNSDLDYKNTSTGEVLVAPLIGNGLFIVIKDFGLKHPYTGQVDLITAEIGDDLAWYFLSSEQTPSSIGLTVLLKENSDEVKVAGGFMLQALPNATDKEISAMETHIKTMPAISTLLLEENPLQTMLDTIYGNISYSILEESSLKFGCDCSKSRFAVSIKSLSSKEVTAMIEEDHGARVTCQFCGKIYQYSEKELNDLMLTKE